MELIRPQPTYDVSKVPVYGDVRFTSGSKDFLNSPQAMEFARKNGGFLQGIGRAIVARVAFHEDNEKTNCGLDGSDDYQKTSTVSIKYHDGKNWQTAFMELPNEDASYKLVDAGYKANRNGSELIIPQNEPLVAKLIGLAQEAGRVRPIFKANPLKLSTEQTRGRSEYGKNKDIIAVVGNAEIAELNASYLQKMQREHGFLYDFTESNIEKMLEGKDGQAVVRPVGLGGGNGISIDDIDDGSSFSGSGRARGEVHGAREIPLETQVAQNSRA